MNARRVMTWVIFWCSVALALSALAWVSVEVVALERREAQSRVQATRQESIRRALWRLDSMMAPVLAVEASRPSSAYESLGMLSTPQGLISSDPGENLSGLPISDAYAKRYFNYAPGSETGAADPIELEYIGSTAQADTREQARSSSLLQARELSDESAGQSLKAQTDSDFAARNRIAQIATQNAPAQRGIEEAVQDTGQTGKLSATPQDDAGESMYGVDLPHSDMSAFTITVGQGEDLAFLQSPPLGSLSPRWIQSDGEPKLVLVRNAMLNGQQVVQGVELDWDQLRTDLLESITDVLPGATLVPSGTGQAAGLYRMATIPVALIPPRAPALPGWSWSPARVGLVVTWIAILATIIAVGVVLRAAIVLSQRRGRFVSAVTHELRTPLTTFRLYSQMLADGMVSDEQVRRDYLSTLKRESERLTGIVENVLEYARLSRVRPGRGKAAGVQTLSPGALVARFRPALARRLGQSNLDLVVSLDLDEHQERTVTVDPHAVERVMMNLIENACKYASPSAEDEPDASEEFDTRVHLDVRVHDEMLELLIADHGPGIAPGERARIFGEFQRGSRGLGNARSGLGLGLALSRGLAREMGGDLQLVSRRGHGAEFLLSIPLDPEP